MNTAINESSDLQGFSTDILVFCKDRSGQKSSGKYSAKTKKERPREKREIKCRKKRFKNVELAKEAIRGAKWARKVAAERGEDTRRGEVRWYTDCACGWVHLTSQGEAEYAARFEAGQRGELRHAA